MPASKKSNNRKKAESAAKKLGGLSGRAAKGLMGRRNRLDMIEKKAAGKKKKK